MSADYVIITMVKGREDPVAAFAGNRFSLLPGRDLEALQCD